MVQVTLDPYMPGGFIEDWMNWWCTVSPDLASNNPEALKIVGTLVLHTLCKTRLLHVSMQPMTTFIGLFGEPSSGKSWILKMVELAFPELVVKAGTPEAIAESIVEQRVGVITWDEVAQLISQAKRRGYMSEFPNLTNQLYNTQSIYMRRRTAETIELPADSYYVSLMLTGLEEDYAGVGELFGRGFERRLIPVYLRGRLPRLPRALDDSEMPNVEHLVRLRRWFERLRDAGFVIRMRGLEKLERERLLEPPEEVRGGEGEVSWFDAAKRLLSAVFIDRVLSGLSEVSEVSDSRSIEIEGFRGVEVKRYSDIQTIRRFQTVDGVKRLYLVDVSENCLIEYAHSLKPLLGYLAECYNRFQPRGELELASYIIRVRRFLERCGGCASKRSLSRWLRIYAHKFDELLKSMEQQGLIVQRVVNRSTYILDPSLRVCGTCRHFGTAACKYDPKREGLVDVLQVEFAQDKCYEPLVGGE